MRAYAREAKKLYVVGFYWSSFVLKKRRGTGKRKLRILTQYLPTFSICCEVFCAWIAGSLRVPDAAVSSVRAKSKTKARSVRNGFAQRKRAANELFSLTLLLSVIDNFC